MALDFCLRSKMKIIPVFLLLCIQYTIGCDEYHTSLTGSISSPNYPGNYPSSSDCTYVIDIQDDGFILIDIVFHYFDLENSYDFLEYGTGSIVDDVVGRFTGDDIPDPFRISLLSESMWFHFTSDSSVNYDGFIFTWKATVHPGNGDIFPDSSGTAQSDGFPVSYPNNANTWYLISSTVGHSMAITFEHFETEHYNDILYFGEGNFPDARCDEYHTTISGVISSPNYPDAYSNYENCEYIIEVPNAVNISIQFDAFELDDG
ncbi:CUB domain-containing protein 2-like [Amphiura filiformis]|uniref:CUB domain-containing protein 2-like n=1 Tax=Amphiura filiformis TaxID=82378 RepID=UPI003B20DF72